MRKIAALALALLAGCAQRPGEDRTVRRAGDIVTQPVRDVGIDKKEIPAILLAAEKGPYAPPRGVWCAAISTELAELDAALGPDFDAAQPGQDSRVGGIAAAGGEMIVNSLIPFRGLVREISGAAPAERRMAVAVTAGVARRGYLRGIAMARGCVRQ